MAKGKINVTADNIFPIIKKFLYSDHEIFLRELVSNAIDATQKLKKLSSIGEAKGEIGDLKVEVIVNKKENTLTIKDHGVGMTDEEVKKYINQIAFSGAEEFVKKYENENKQNSIIGHFGLGFYSSFMVSDKVHIRTLSYQDGAQSVEWECDGSPEFSLKKADKKDRGTEVILHIDEDSKDFLEDHKINELLNKYCKFLPVPIQFGTKEETSKDDNDKEIKKTIPNIINNPSPVWTKKPTNLKDEDYVGFYKELYPFTDDPLFWIHLNVDYPFNLTGVLYFPKISNNFELQKEKIQLYCKQVFVTDAVEGIVPDFLMLLRGVIDSPDIPLNVSRSYLQSDHNVKKINNHIMKKVADKLNDLFKKDRKSFEEKWDDIKMIIEYGMFSEEKFYEKAQKFCLLKSVDGSFSTLEEYKKKVEVGQKDKNDKIVYLYTNNMDEQHTFIEAAKNKGYDVLLLDGVIDNHFINHMESKLENSSFVRVDSNSVDKLIDKDETTESVLTKEQEEVLKPIIEKQVEGKTGTFNVTFESLSPNEQPITVTKPEFMRRMKDMSQMGGNQFMMGDMPDQYNLVINANHPLITKIVGLKKENDKTSLLNQALDLALLSQNLLKGEALTKFINRSVELIDN
jgi:molecular chaperone HtpG